MGCSFLYARPPRSGTEEGAPAASASTSHLDRKAGCSGLNPLYDFTWVLGGGAAVLAANRLEEESVPDLPPGAMWVGAPPQAKDYSGLRYFGYGEMAFFGASALWGAYVQTQCMGADNALKQQAAADQQKARERGPFPSVVLGFTLGMSATQAERMCRGRPGDYVSDGATATCSSRAPGATEKLRFQFAVGALSQVAVLYRPPADQLAKHYDQLFAALSARYGAPQLDRSPLPADCKAALVACLERGVAVKGASWYWPRGSVTLAPIWNVDHAELDLRYTLQEAAE
jgi:hypothetical protein